jgi:uncharacterized membrane protein
MMFLWIPLLLVPFGIVWLLRRDGDPAGCGVSHASHTGATMPGGSDPLDIARVRLARGEITVGQFDEIRRALGR